MSAPGEPVGWTLGNDASGMRAALNEVLRLIVPLIERFGAVNVINALMNAYMLVALKGWGEAGLRRGLGDALAASSDYALRNTPPEGEA